MSAARPRVAPHVAELPKSGIRKFFDIVAQSKDVISLGIGEPDFVTPFHIRDVAISALERGHTSYTDNRGLIALRKAHPILRMTSVYDILSNLIPVRCEHPQVGAFRLSCNVENESAEEMFIIFSAAKTPQKVALPAGKWQVLVNGEKAGTEPLAIAESSVTLQPISAMVLVR